MSNFGVTPQGFRRKTANEIRQQISQALRDEFGSKTRTDDESILGKLTLILTERLSELWETNEDSYHASYRSSAEGFSLENVAQLIGLSKVEASPTVVIVRMFGEQGTVVSASSPQKSVEISETNETFILRNSVTITRSNAALIDVEVNTVTEGATYSITINNETFSYEAQPGDGELEILQGLENLIDDVQVSKSLENNILNIVHENLTGSFSSLVTSNLTISRLASPGTFDSENDGPVQAPANSIDEIVTPVSGWESVDNPTDGELGREQETDLELRQRMAQSTRIVGTASTSAISARVQQNVNGVSSVLIFENRSNDIDEDGRPPHSFETVVEGGEVQEIANEIFNLKPAGIETTGNVSTIVIDSNGDEQPIEFSRPVPIFIWVKCEIEILNADDFPDGGQSAIEQIIEEFGNGIGVGSPIIKQSFIGPIFEIPGIRKVTLSFASGDEEIEPDPSEFNGDVLEIGTIETPVFDLSRIEVTLV